MLKSLHQVLHCEVESSSLCSFTYIPLFHGGKVAFQDLSNGKNNVLTLELIGD